MSPTRDPFSKINPRAIPGPIIHVRLKICRNSSILRIRVIIILKKSRNRNIKYKSLQNSVLIYKDTVPLFTKKITTAVLIRGFECKMVSEDHIHSLLILWDLYKRVLFTICVLKKVVYAVVHSGCFTKC